MEKIEIFQAHKEYLMSSIWLIFVISSISIELFYDHSVIKLGINNYKISICQENKCIAT